MGVEEIELMSTQLEEEIREQPRAIERILRSSRGAIDELCRQIRKRDIVYIMIAARGSSDNAGIYAKYVFPAFNGLPVAMTTPSLFTFYKKPPRLRNVLVLGISQSGQSEDIVEVLAVAGKQGALTAAITSDKSSPLADAAAHVLLLDERPEKSVAATKTFSGSLAILALLSAALEKDTERLAGLECLPAMMERTIALSEEAAREKAERYRYMDRCVVIGRGFSYAIAFEIALKLKELTYVTAVPYSSADFLHGPMAMVEPGFPVVLIAPRGKLFPHLKEFALQLVERSAELIVISDAEEMLKLGKTRLPIPEGSPEWLCPALEVIPGQLLSLHLAIAKGFDPDAPRGLRKVTVTR